MSRSGLAAAAMDGWPEEGPSGVLRVGYFLGEGIGTEIVPPALAVLQAVCDRFGRRLELHAGGLIGKPALETSGSALTEEVAAFCAEHFASGGAVLCGPGGARFVYELRARFGLFCKLTPFRPCPALADSSVFRPEHLRGVDILAVRENTGGLYFGESNTRVEPESGTVVRHGFEYSAVQVRRILASAFAAARRRTGRLCVTIKPGGVPAISRLWQEEAEALAAEAGVELSILEIDNAGYQLIANPRAFDVVVSPNMFGDILADTGALLLGSRGMSYSGNFGPDGRAVYQTGHGAAHDIAGTDRANPVGQVLSVAMMLEESLGLPEGAGLIRAAVESVLGAGYRTADIAGSGGRVVGTREMGALLLDAVVNGGVE